MKEIEAIILADGKGVRMGKLTQEKQKCLLPIDERPTLDHVIDNLVSAFGSVDLKVAIDYKSEQVIEFVDKKKSKKISVTYLPHSGDVGGWEIYRGLCPFVRGRFIATPGDIIALPEAYERIVATFDNNDVDGAMTLSPDLGAIDTHGVGRIENGWVVDLKWPPPSNIKKRLNNRILGYFDAVCPRKRVSQILFMIAICLCLRFGTRVYA